MGRAGRGVPPYEIWNWLPTRFGFLSVRKVFRRCELMRLRTGGFCEQSRSQLRHLSRSISSRCWLDWNWYVLNKGRSFLASFSVARSRWCSRRSFMLVSIIILNNDLGNNPGIHSQWWRGKNWHSQHHSRALLTMTAIRKSRALQLHSSSRLIAEFK